jgi:hypothetical protein
MMQVERIKQVWPNLSVETITNEFGTAIKLSGKGAKVAANYIARENYYDGIVDTLWRDVRHGLGYAVPLYDNPLNSIL